MPAHHDGITFYKLHLMPTKKKLLTFSQATLVLIFIYSQIYEQIFFFFFFFFVCPPFSGIASCVGTAGTVLAYT